MSPYLSDALRRAAAGEDVTDLRGLCDASANAIERLTADLARATGRSEAVVAHAEGLRTPQRAVPGADSTIPRPDRPLSAATPSTITARRRP